MRNRNLQATESAVTQDDLPHALKVFVSVVLALTILALVSEAICRHVFHLGAPYSSPFLDEIFPDYINLWARLQHFHTLDFYTDTVDPLCMYPAPIAVCYWVLFRLGHSPIPFLSLVLLCFIVSAFIFGRSLLRRNLGREATVFLITFSLITSFPLWFELNQANLEICSWVLLALGTWFLFRERGYSAAACFGIAGAMKITPFFYLGIFVAKRQYRQVLVALSCAAAVTILSLWLVYPKIADSWRLTNMAISRFRTVVTLRTYPQLAFDHSLFGLIKRLLFWHINIYHLSTLLTVYSATAAISMLVLFLGWIRKLPFANQLICLCAATLILPPTSFDYTLMSLYLPWSLLVLHAIQQQRRGQTSPGLVPAMVCFAILFVPETEIIVRHESIAGQIKAVTLVALVLIGLRYPFPLTAPDSGVAA